MLIQKIKIRILKFKENNAKHCISKGYSYRIKAGNIYRIAPALLFIFIALLQGVYYIRYIGALTMPDGSMHALGAYSLATGQSFNQTDGWTDSYGNHRRAQRISGDARLIELRGAHNDLVSNIIQMYYPIDSYLSSQIEGASGEAKSIEYPLTDGIFYNHNRANQYFPTTWLPQAIGIKIGMLFNFDPYDIWQAGRCANLLCFVVLYSIAIVMVPRMKWLLTLLGVIPTTLFAASSLMCDATLVAVCTLSVSLTIKIVEENKMVSTAQTLLLGLLCGFMVLSKAVYAPICMGFLLLPNSVMSWRQKLLPISVVLLSTLIYIVFNVNFGDMALSGNLSINKEIAMSNPFAILVRIIYQIINLPILLILAGQMYITIGIVFLTYVVNYISSNHIARADSLGKLISKYRFLFGAIAAVLIAVMGTFLFLLLTWNDLSTQATLTPIGGFQGRYLLPVYPAILYLQTIFTYQSA